eukprot:augustus_masked-scaffold_3-processed-gene-4.52-mRNA-1 protein AED:0.38 eAED:0.39 QI:0/-1/0/1/-1/1/1/0/500
MKLAMIEAPVLQHPNFKHPFIVYSDASKFGVGGVLVQEYDKKPHIISYFSRKFRPEELGKGIPEKEMIGLVESLEDFRIYIFAKDVEVRVDQASLKWLAEVQHPHRFSNYAMRLAPYQINVKVIPGEKNKADFFSRYLLFIRRSVQSNLTKDDFYKHYLSNRELDSFVFDRSVYNTKDLTMDKDTLYYRNRVLIPRSNVESLLKKIHTEDIRTSHLGIVRTAELVKKLYYWPGWQKDVSDFVKGCNICKKSKSFSRPAEKAGRIGETTAPNEVVSIDIYGSGSLRQLKGFNAVLSVVCHHTRFTMFFPIKSKYASEIVNVLEKEWCLRYGYPKEVHADNEFRADVIENWMRRYEVEQSFSGIYAPWQNGVVERSHRFLTEQIKIQKEEGNEDWVELLPYISYKLNIGCKKDGEKSPLELFHSGHQVRISPKLDLRKEKAGQELEAGDWVYHKPTIQKKFAEKRGPFKILNKMGSNVYTIDSHGEEVQVARQNLDKAYSGE